MPSGSYHQVHVKCPFYTSDNGKNRICCEGLLPGSQTQSFFWHRKDYETQIGLYCCGGYQTCEIYMGLMEQYAQKSEC